MGSRPSGISSNSASPSVVSSTQWKLSHVNEVYSPVYQLSMVFFSQLSSRVDLSKAGRSVKTQQPRHSCGFQHFPSCWTHLRWRLLNWLWGHYIKSRNLCCALIVSMSAFCLFQSSQHLHLRRRKRRPVLIPQLGNSQTLTIQMTFIYIWQDNGVRSQSLAGHVGFDSLPDQLVNKSICQGFCFNILCIGNLT